MPSSIILIGPGKAGKTTLSKALGERLGLPALDLDDLRFDYYREIGYDHDKAQAIRQAGGMKALADHWKPFDIHGVERILQDYPEDHVIAFGAGHSIYDDAAQLARAQKALAGFRVILVLPTADADESYQILRQRLRDDEPEFPDHVIDGIMAVNRGFITHASNISLANMTVYTAGKSIEESCQEIMEEIAR